MYKSIISEYGAPWVFSRFLYSAKIRLMKTIPKTEKLFEKNVNIKRIDIFKVDVNRIDAFLNAIPNTAKDEIIQIADQAMIGKIKAFSSLELNYGDPMNWHLNPITNFETDKTTKWYNISDFDSSRGDIKAIWEASRLTHFFYYARGYILTKDIKYYEAFSSQLEHWLNQNPYSYGANYKCGQEATLRMLNSLIVYSVFNAYGLTTKEDENNLKKVVNGSYKKVLSNFFYAHKCIKNNHTLSEITGMIVGAWCSEDRTLIKKAYHLMDKEIHQQFMEDGGYIQYSFNYQRFALQIMEFMLKISEVVGVELSKQSKKLINKSAFMMYQMQDETGDVPNYGSNDGALIFPLTTSSYRDFRPVLNTVYALTKGKRLYEQGNYDEELLWFSDLIPGELPIANIKKESAIFEDSGFNVMRHQDGFLITVLQDFKTRPAQMDQMHIDLWHKGVNVLCDSGTYSYASDLGDQMALTAAHNTVKVDGREQMRKHGPFLIYDWTRVKDIESNGNYFKGTMVSRNGYSHTRVINKSIDGYKIEDIVNSEVENFKILFHTPCQIVNNNSDIDLIFDGKVIARIITDGKIEINECYRSLYYLKKEKITQVSIFGKTNESVNTHIFLAK